MALLADSSADASSNLVQGVGSNTVTFTMPKNVAIKVESVVATVDNAAGGATTGKVTVKDNSGQVIGTNTQGDTIPAAGSGTATFALGLAKSGSAGIRFDVDNEGGYLRVVGTGTDPLSGDGLYLEFTKAVGIQSDTDDVAIQAGRNVTETASQAVHLVSGAETQVDATTAINLNATTSLNTLSGGDTVITSQGDVISSANGEYDVTAKVLINCQLTQAGATFEVRDHLNNPLLRVTENGTYHILTGAAWVADL